MAKFVVEHLLGHTFDHDYDNDHFKSKRPSPNSARYLYNLINSIHFELDPKTYAMSCTMVLVSALPLACPPAYLPRPIGKNRKC